MTDEPTPLDTLVNDNVRLDPHSILANALSDDDLEDIVILARHKDGGTYVASSVGLAETLLLIEQSRFNMIRDSVE